MKEIRGTTVPEHANKLPEYLREYIRNPAAEIKPNIGDICEAGKSMGLDEKDIINLYRKKHGVRIKNFLAKYWYFFLPVLIFVAIVIVYVLVNLAPPDPWANYPRGTLYNVVGPKDFKKRIPPFKTGIHL
jgi:hypothetical protein